MNNRYTISLELQFLSKFDAEVISDVYEDAKMSHHLENVDAVFEC